MLHEIENNLAQSAHEDAKEKEIFCSYLTCKQSSYAPVVWLVAMSVLAISVLLFRKYFHLYTVFIDMHIVRCHAMNLEGDIRFVPCGLPTLANPLQARPCTAATGFHAPGSRISLCTTSSNMPSFVPFRGTQTTWAQCLRTYPAYLQRAPCRSARGSVFQKNRLQRSL